MDINGKEADFIEAPVSAATQLNLWMNAEYQAFDKEVTVYKRPSHAAITIQHLPEGNEFRIEISGATKEDMMEMLSRVFKVTSDLPAKGIPVFQMAKRQPPKTDA